MPNRDYAVRNKKGKVSVPLIISLISLLIFVSAIALWLLKENASTNTIPTQSVSTQQAKSTLPSPPEEMYSYIRDLETREIPIDKNSKLVKLTKEQEQEQQLQRQKELEEQKKIQEQAQITEQVTAKETEKTTEMKTVNAELEKKAQEKRKQAEQKQQEIAKKVAEQKAKAESTKPKEKEAPKAVAKYGLQCGAFKNKAQAENMQARLAMSGYNARINSNGEWNRVVVGPIGDRASAVSAQSNAKSVAECLVVGM